MALRTALPKSATVSKAGGADPFTITSHNLGESTAITPSDQEKGVLAGYSRPTGAPFDVVLEAFDGGEHFATLDGWQVDGELLDVVLTYDDDSTKTAKNVGFTVAETTPANVGDLDGWTLTGFTQAATVADALTVAPAY